MAFDYHDTDCVDRIKDYTGNALDYAIDCFCTSASMKFCYGAIGRAGGRYTTLEPYAEQSLTRKRVNPEWILSLALLGKTIGWKKPYGCDANPELRAFGREWFRCAQRLLTTGEVKPHPVRVGDRTGFEAVLDGLEILKQGQVSGEKLVYRIP